MTDKDPRNSLQKPIAGKHSHSLQQPMTDGQIQALEIYASRDRWTVYGRHFTTVGLVLRGYLDYDREKGYRITENGKEALIAIAMES